MSAEPKSRAGLDAVFEGISGEDKLSESGVEQITDVEYFIRSGRGIAFSLVKCFHFS